MLRKLCLSSWTTCSIFVTWYIILYVYLGKHWLNIIWVGFCPKKNKVVVFARLKASSNCFFSHWSLLSLLGRKKCEFIHLFEWYIFLSPSCASDHIDRIGLGSGVHHHIMLHFSQLQPQHGLRLHPHWDRVLYRRVCPDLPWVGLPDPSRSFGSEKFQLHLQLKVEHVPAFPALWDDSVCQETPEQSESAAGTQQNLPRITFILLHV